MTKARLWLLSLAFIGSATSLGCGRAHLSSNYGQSYAAWFATQTVNKKGANPAESKRIIESLDAQEATAVSKTYRKSSKGGDEGGGRMVMIGTSRPGGGSEGYMPPPSVPQ